MAKVALAHDHLFQNGGAERVLAILAGLNPEAPIYTLINNPDISSKLFDQNRIKTSYLQKIPAVNLLFKSFLPLMPKVWEQTDFSNYDLVVSSSSGFVKGLKKGANTKHVCYCHTSARYLWDDMEEYIGNLPISPILRLFLPRILNYLQSWDFNKAKEVDYFIANSTFIAEKIKKHYQRDSVVIHPSVRVDDFSLAPTEELGNYFLIVSRLRPYKRVDLAIKAFNNLKLPLKIIGSGSQLNKLKKQAFSNIEFLGELSDQERNYHLARCQAFIYPQVEDFGISALEAMASGRPVIALARGGALETVVAGKTGEFFDHQDWASLTHAILRFQNKQFDSQVIREHARLFDDSVFREKIRTFLAQL